MIKKKVLILSCLESRLLTNPVLFVRQGKVHGGSLPGRQTFPACEATAAERRGPGGNKRGSKGSKEGGRTETEQSMRYEGGVML